MSNNQPPPPGTPDGSDWSSQPNPYGPPPQQQGWPGQQPGQWAPPGQHPGQWAPPAPHNPYGPPPQQPGPGTPQWGAPGTNPMPTQGPPSGPQTWAPPPRKRRAGAVIAVLVTLAVLLGGGMAIAFAVQDDNKDDSSQATDPAGGATDPVGGGGTPSPSPTDPESTEPVAPQTTAPVDPSPSGPDGPKLPQGTGVDTTGRDTTAADFQRNWEFRWEDNVYNARHIVSRDLETCTDVNPDATLADQGCQYAVTATYVNEQDKVRFTHVIFAFKNAKQAEQAKADEVITDKILDLPDDAVWQDFEKGSWITKQQDAYVVFTVATGPAQAKQKKLSEYLRWSNTDFALSLMDWGF